MKAEIQNSGLKTEVIKSANDKSHTFTTKEELQSRPKAPVEAGTPIEVVKQPDFKAAKV